MPVPLTSGDDAVISTREAAKVIGVSERTIRRYVAVGILRARMSTFRVKHLDIDSESVREFLTKYHRVPATAS